MCATVEVVDKFAIASCLWSLVILAQRFDTWNFESSPENPSFFHLWQTCFCLVRWWS